MHFSQCCQNLEVVKCLGFLLHAFVQAGRKVLSLARFAGWDSSIRELRVQVMADKSSACCIPPVISGSQSCLPPPAAGKSWQRRDNIWFKICSCQVIDRVRKTNTWREQGWVFSLLNLWAKSRLLQWKSRCRCFRQLLQDVVLGHERRFEEHFAVMVADLLHFWLQLTAHSHPLSLILLVHRPGGNWNISLLSHTPSSPRQQMGKYYSGFFFFFNLQVDW